MLLEMKRLFISLLFVVGAIFSINAETLAPGVVKGSVVDYKTKTAMEFVNVAVKAKGTTAIVNAGVTDSQGDFILGGLKKGAYEVSVSCVGYKPVTRVIYVDDSKSSIVLNSIALVEDSHVLKEVSVVGQKSQMKFEIDKKVFNVGQDLSSAGGSASDVLSNIPSVNVDNDGNVSLRGNSSVTIWINGKASGLSSDNQGQILDQLPAESIDRIEVITNPSAKYSAEGTAGIINIILKEDRKAGYFGSLRAGVRSNGSVVSGSSINYSSKKLDANLDLGYLHRIRSSNSYVNRTNTQNTTDTSDDTFLKQNSDVNNSANGIFVRGGVAYHFNKKDQAYINGMGIFGHNKGVTILNYNDRNATDLIYNSLRRSDSKLDMNGGNMTMGFKHEFAKDNLLDLSVSYNKWSMDNSSVYNQNYTNNYKESSYQQQANDIRNKNWEFQLDYQDKLNDDSKIEAGWKTTLGRENSPVQTYSGISQSTATFEESLYNRFIYNQDIHSGYVTYSGKLNKFGYQIGLRGEYTKVTTKSNTWADGAEQDATPYMHDYFDLFPSVFVSYTLSTGNELQVNYSRRINRPWGGQLNSFRNITDPTNISYGNPQLKPQFANSFELNYIKNWNQNTLSISTYYHSTNDVIQSVSYMDNTKNVMYSTYMNIAKTQSTGVELVEKSTFFKILDLTTTLNGYYNKLDGFIYISPLTETGTYYSPDERFAWNAQMIANVILPYSWSLQVTGKYNSKQAIAQGTMDPNYSVDAGLKKTFFNKKWTLSMNVRDLFNSLKNHNFTSGSSFVQESNTWRDGRRFGVTVTYSFGNMKNKKNKQQQQPADEDSDSQNIGNYN